MNLTNYMAYTVFMLYRPIVDNGKGVFDLYVT